MLINIHDAKTHFSKLINQSLKGEEIVIKKDGKPLVRLVPSAMRPLSLASCNYRSTMLC